MFDPSILPPLPSNLEDSHREIRYLQYQLYLSREHMAKSIEEREKDRRAARGNINALKQEVKNLRELFAQTKENNE